MGANYRRMKNSIQGLEPSIFIKKRLSKIVSTSYSIKQKKRNKRNRTLRKSVFHNRN